MRGYKFRRRPHRIRKRKSILKSRFFRNLIFFLVIVGSGVYFFIFSDFFQIKDVIITGQEKIISEEIKAAIKRELGKSIFLVNSKRVREIVLQKFPQIAELEIKKRFPNILNLALAERKEVAILCDEISCFLLDDKGVVFAKASLESDLPKLRNKNLARQLTLGETVFDKENLEKILEIYSKLKNNLGILVDELSLEDSEKLAVRTSEGWEIYFNIKKDINWQMVSLATLLEKKLPLEKRKGLKYIDLRFNKIFVYPSFD